MLYIYRDNDLMAIVETETQLYRWFHSRHSYSIDHAVTYEGYLILDGNGSEVRA